MVGIMWQDLQWEERKNIEDIISVLYNVKVRMHIL